MSDITGKYKMLSSENFDEYLKAVGVGFALRQVASRQSPTFYVTIEGDEYTLKTESTFKTTEIKCKLGEEFDETTADGRKLKTTCTREGDTLIQSSKGEVDTTLTRVFNGDDMALTCVAKGVTATRKYKREH